MTKKLFPVYKFFVLFLMLSLGLIKSLHAQTKITIDLDSFDDRALHVSIAFDLPLQETYEWVIPTIIPGTYMALDYYQFFDRIEAYDLAGNKLKIKRKKNVFHIQSVGYPLQRMDYHIHESIKEGPLWKEILGCAGTLFSSEGFLFNFQLVAGYIKGFDQVSIEVQIESKSPWFATTSLKTIIENERFQASNYAQLIDQPLMLSKQPSASFSVGFNQFNVGVVSEKERQNAANYAEALKSLMKAQASYSGFTDFEEYSFLIYHVDFERLKGPMKYFGIGSALEHRHSSVYYYSDVTFDSTYSHLNSIVPHEYLHTLAPLNLHSEQIHHFNFEKSVMSQHLWLYEGVTDYLSSQMMDSYPNADPLLTNLTIALQQNEKRKERSMTESSANIISNSLVQWPSKMTQLINFYQKGKLIGWALDLEIIEHSQGQSSLLQVLSAMKLNHPGDYLPDTSLLDSITAYANVPSLDEFFDRYVEGDQTLPWDYYGQKVGWDYQAKGEKVLAFANKMKLYYNFDHHKYRIHKISSNELGLKKGDLIESINGVSIGRFQSESLKPLYQPIDNTTLVVEVLRAGQRITLSGRPSEGKKLKQSRWIPVSAPTEKQIQMYQWMVKSI